MYADLLSLLTLLLRALSRFLSIFPYFNAGINPIQTASMASRLIRGNRTEVNHIDVLIKTLVIVVKG